MLIKKIRESLMYFKKRDENYKSVNSVSEHQSNYKYFSEFVHFYNFHLILRYITIDSQFLNKEKRYIASLQNNNARLHINIDFCTKSEFYFTNLLIRII